MDNKSLMVARKFLLKNLPPELVDYILEFIYEPLRKELMLSITQTLGTKSVWWNPSGRLLELCRHDSGAIQVDYFDEWTMFKDHLGFVEFALEEYYDIIGRGDDTPTFPEYAKELWQRSRCGWKGFCPNCIAYNFPCSNAAKKNEEKYSHIWDIQDDPRFKLIINYYGMNMDYL